MKEIISKLYDVLEESISSCKSNVLSLSGGLDSTILAYYLQQRKPNTIVIISRDFLATDLTYSQLVAKEFSLPLKIKSVPTEELITGVEECIKILKNFNDIEIRNSVVIYEVLRSVKDSGETLLMTGDGADELFAGYNFLLNKSEEDLEKDLKRIWSIMHFPSIKLGKSLGVTVENPFLNDSVQEFAKSLPVSMKVGIKDDKKYGKWILRKAFEDKIPKSIAWRDKYPLQDGAGTSGLITLFDSVIIDDVFQKKKKEILEADGVNIRTKESLHYYEVYRKYYDEPAKLQSSDIQCPYCQFAIEQNSKFCRMCGAFPI